MKTEQTDTEIGAEINAEHQLAAESFSSGMEHAIKCGQLLHRQKRTLKHGEFIPWVKANCDFSYETAKVYMLAVREKGRGLSFSSLKQLVHRNDDKKPASSSESCDPYSFSTSPPDDLRLRKDQDANQLLYAVRIDELFRWLARNLRDIDVRTAVNGTLPYERQARIALLREVHRRVADLHQAYRCADFGMDYIPLNDLTFEERDSAMWDVLKPQPQEEAASPLNS